MKIFCTNMFVIAVLDFDDTLVNNCGCDDTCSDMFVIVVPDIDETLMNNCGCEDTLHQYV